MGHIEWQEKKRNNYPIVDLNMEGVEVEGEKHIVWESETEKRKITYTVLGGGPWGETWTKSLSLTSTDKLVGSEMMRVELSKSSLNGEVSKTIYVETFIFEHDAGKGKTLSFAYSLDNDGQIEQTGLQVGISSGEVEEYMEALLTETIRVIDDLPERIDVEETIRLFLEQIEERRLSMPTLIAA